MGPPGVPANGRRYRAGAGTLLLKKTVVQKGCQLDAAAAAARPWTNQGTLSKPKCHYSRHSCVCCAGAAAGAVERPVGCGPLRKLQLFFFFIWASFSRVSSVQTSLGAGPPTSILPKLQEGASPVFGLTVRRATTTSATRAAAKLEDLFFFPWVPLKFSVWWPESLV